MNIDASADRISSHHPQGEHPRRERRSANPDLVALDLLPAGTVAIVNDGGRVVEIV
jgi:hypothetical protein